MPIITTVGFIGGRKGYFYLADALAILKTKGFSFEWHIIGEGQDRDGLQKKLYTVGLPEHVKFMGKLQHNLVLADMHKSNIFCLPSHDEPFGIVYLEAMSSKVPIVGSKGEGIEDIVVDGINGILVQSKSPDSIAKGLESLLIDRKYAAVIAEKGYLTAQKYTWENNAKETLEILKKIIASDRRSEK